MCRSHICQKEHGMCFKGKKKKKISTPNKQRNKDYASKQPAWWNIICSARGLLVGAGITRTGCASSFSPDHGATELKSNQTEPFQAVWPICEVHQTAPQRTPTQKLHTASLQQDLEAQMETTPRSASHTLNYKNQRCRYWPTCSGLLMVGQGPVLLLNEAEWTTEKLANICGYFRLRQFPDWSCLIPSAKWK